MGVMLGSCIELMDDPEPPVDVDAPPPPLEWAAKDMRARVDIADRDAVQDVLDRDAGWMSQQAGPVSLVHQPHLAGASP